MGPLSTSTGSNEGRPRRGVAVVLMDASALLAPFQIGLDFEWWIGELLGGALICVSEDAVRELQALRASGGAKVSREAGAALELAKHYNIVPSEGRGDRGILEMAKRRGWAVATCDLSLRDALLREGVPVLSPEGGRVSVRGGEPWSRGMAGCSSW